MAMNDIIAVFLDADTRAGGEWGGRTGGICTAYAWSVTLRRCGVGGGGDGDGGRGTASGRNCQGNGGVCGCCSPRRRGRGQTQGHTYEPCGFLFAVVVVLGAPPPLPHSVIRRPCPTTSSSAAAAIILTPAMTVPLCKYFRFRNHRRGNLTAVAVLLV